MRTPGQRKRAMKSARKTLTWMIETRLQSRSCYWTWPWGHDWETDGAGLVTTRSSDWRRISRCEHCHKPFSWDSFDLYDMVKFAEEYTEIREDVLDDFLMIWARRDE